MHGLRVESWPLLLLLLPAITNPWTSATTLLSPREEDGSSSSSSDDAPPAGLQITHTGGPEVCQRPTQAGDTIAVHYRGSLAATGDEFDASYNRGQPFTFTLGAGQVIAGWDQGLVGMCVGESRQLTIPPELGYGRSGTGPIPPNAVLVFDTRLEDLVALAPGSDPIVSEPAGLPATDETAGMTATAAVTATGASTATDASTTTVNTTAVVDTAAAVTATSTPDADVESAASSAADTATATEDILFTIATAPPTPPADMEEDETSGQDGLEVIGGASEWDDEGQNKALEDSQLGEVDGTPLPDAHESVATPTMVEEEQAECHLLGPFAVFVQGALGALALLALVWKRWREHPKRPWKIFFFDASKQIFGSLLTHIINLAMSKLGSDGMQVAAAQAFSEAGTDAAGRKPNPCSFYLLNLAIDTTIGVPVLYVLLKVLYALFLFTPLARPPQAIKSGHYGQPPKVNWYLRQLLIYCLGLVGMKVFVYFMFKAMPWLPWVGDWALRWTKGNEALEIAFSLFVFPLGMNAVQYYVIDNFIMDKKAEEHGYLQVGTDEDSEERQRMMGSDDDDVDGADVHHVRGKNGDLSDSDSSLNRSNNLAGSLTRGNAGSSRSPPSERSKQA